MKKTISFIMAVCLMLSSAVIGTFAADDPVNTFYYGNDKEILISGEDISQQKMQFIADFVADGTDETNDNAVPYGIFCLFGHSLATTSAKETTHNVYSTTPKCVIKTYKVEYCTRSSCDYITKELISSVRTSACHG